MSTYSWSYKTAVHRQTTTKHAKTEQGSCDTNDVCQNESDKIVLHNSRSQSNDAVSIVTPKRLNWRAKLYVGNLNKKTNEASLAYYFSVFGDIEDIKLIRDHNTKESRGFAFITFEKIDSAERAKKWCSYNYPTLDDNSITVASAERKAHKIKIAKNDERAKRRPSQTLFWEFKWTDSNDAEVYGPYETSLMQAWKNQGYFDRACWVRQVLRRQISRADGEKQKVQTNIPEVTRAEELQNAASGNTFEGNLKDESDEDRPCKKPKLVIAYSDSEDECGDGDEECGDAECGGILNVNERSAKALPCYEGEHLKLQENEKENDSSLNKDHLQLHESNDKLDSVVKQDEGICSSEHCKDEHLQPHESDLSTVKKKQSDTFSESLANDEEKEDDVKETTLKHINNENERSVGEEIHGIKMRDNILEQQKQLVQTHQIGQENTSNEDQLSGNEQSMSNKVEGNVDILQMYEQGPLVLSEHGDHSMINDEDLRQSDDSSSEEEDIENDDDISTEFVAVSEIDFNFYP